MGGFTRVPVVIRFSLPVHVPLEELLINISLKYGEEPELQAVG
jgi:hypothetical protein